MIIDALSEFIPDDDKSITRKATQDDIDRL